MPRVYSTTFHNVINDTGAPEAPLILLEINHPDLTTPIRVVNDRQDLVSNGNTFIAMAFRAALPSEPEKGLPKARLAMDNVGKELVTWIDGSNGGEGATVRMMQVLRSNPDNLEVDITMDLSDVTMDSLEVTATLGFEDLLNRPAVMLSYRPDKAPGVF